MIQVRYNPIVEFFRTFYLYRNTWTLEFQIFYTLMLALEMWILGRILLWSMRRK